MTESAKMAAVLSRIEGRLVLTAHQRRVVDRIIKCGTGEMGSALYGCSGCMGEVWVPCACRDRHCGRCQGSAQKKWLTARIRESLPTPYFHVVFTVPHDLNDLFPSNEILLYNTAFKAASEVMMAVVRSELGGQAGFISVLHTWTTDLHYHVHIHMIVAGGALADGGDRWIPSRGQYLVPDAKLRILWRANFIEKLRRAYVKNQLVFRKGFNDHLERFDFFLDLIDTLYAKEWLVTTGRPARVQTATGYLSRYIYKTAISESRILMVGDDHVTIKVRRYVRGSREPIWSEANIDLLKFGQRFVRHILPKGFQRVRYSGFMAPNKKAATVAKIREMIAADTGMSGDTMTNQINNMIEQLSPQSETRSPACETCKTPMHFIRYERNPPSNVPVAKTPPVSAASQSLYMLPPSHELAPTTNTS